MELRKIEYELQQIRIALQTIAKYAKINKTEQNKNKGIKQNESDNKKTVTGTI